MFKLAVMLSTLLIVEFLYSNHSVGGCWYVNIVDHFKFAQHELLPSSASTLQRRSHKSSRHGHLVKACNRIRFWCFSGLFICLLIQNGFMQIQSNCNPSTEITNHCIGPGDFKMADTHHESLRTIRARFTLSRLGLKLRLQLVLRLGYGCLLCKREG